MNTDKQRVERYDAVRPDVMSHLVLGEGYDSYDPLKFRFLDNEYLGLLINTVSSECLACWQSSDPSSR